MRICVLVVNDDAPILTAIARGFAHKWTVTSVEWDEAGAKPALVGAAGGVAATLNGKIAEHIIYSRVLTAPEIAQVLTYLGARYGIAIGA